MTPRESGLLNLTPLIFDDKGDVEKVVFELDEMLEIE